MSLQKLASEVHLLFGTALNVNGEAQGQPKERQTRLRMTDCRKLAVISSFLGVF